jgi:glutamate-1-semialdehyde aminotransferase
VGFRFSTKEMLYPIVGQRSLGSKLWDIDGNEYVDLTMGFGVHLFGNRPPFVADALRAEIATGVDLGPRSALAGEVAELVCELTGHERVAFCNSGTEAVMTAIRLARARTGRTRIAIFSGSYHGHSDATLAEGNPAGGPFDSSPIAPGIPQGVASDVLVLAYGAEESLAILRQHGSTIAAVLVEPVQSRHPSLQPIEFLRELRGVTEGTGTALIFDEMITGFRVHPAGAQGLFGIKADLATYGKIVGGGMPIGVVAGSAAYMNGIDGGPWQYADRSYPKEEMTFFGGTFCQHPLAMAAARAVLLRLRAEGPALQQALGDKTAEFARAANELLRTRHAPVKI